MFDRRGRDDAWLAEPLGDPGERCHAQDVAFGTAAREHDLVARPAEQRRDLGAGPTDARTYPPALIMDGRRVAARIQRVGQGRTGGRVQRTCGVEVEVDPPVR